MTLHLRKKSHALICAVALISPISLISDVTYAKQIGYADALSSYTAGNYTKLINDITPFVDSKDPERAIDALVHRADAHLRLGEIDFARRDLTQARDLLNKINDKGATWFAPLINIQFAETYLTQSNTQLAEPHLTAARAALANMPDSPLHAKLVNAQSQFDAYKGQGGAAFKLLSTNAKTSPSPEALINVARLAVQEGELTQLEQALETAVNAIATEQATAERANYHLAIGTLYANAITQYQELVPSHFKLKAKEQFNATLNLGTQLNDSLLVAQSNRALGELLEDSRNPKDAEIFARQAVFNAQNTSNALELYLSQWLLARSIATQGKLDQAVSPYEQALDIIGRIRYDIAASSPDTYRKLVGPAYYQYADLQLRRIHNMPEGDARQKTLAKLRDALEQVKQAEVDDYFNNQCMTRDKAKVGVSNLAEGTAVIYPILLADRLEILLVTPGTLQQASAPIGKNQLEQLIRQFRFNLEKDTGTSQHLQLAQKLNDLLIRPLEPALQQAKVHTLVIVPDGPLRTIPLAALHDGKQYLIERFAITTTPGLQLVDAGAPPPKNISYFMGGVSESVQNMPALPGVAKEIDLLKSRTGSNAFLNAEFTRQRVSQGLAQPKVSVAHLATHGEFSSDYQQSYLLTYDGKFTLPQLEKAVDMRELAGEQPLDLLVLSACKTAAGDERAALGLAGVAVQAGARSVLASLWYISDKAATQLMDHFYQELRIPGNSKAESLRLAQIALIDQPQTSHPSNWAPFMLIGSWM